MGKRFLKPARVVPPARPRHQIQNPEVHSRLHLMPACHSMKHSPVADINDSTHRALPINGEAS
jgi:hypothetical protein